MYKTKDGNFVPISDLTADNYVVPKGEELCYHCVIEVVQFNQRTGEKISSPRIQKFGRKIFEQTVRDSLLKQGYKVKILYSPVDYIKSQEEKRQATSRPVGNIDDIVAKKVEEKLAEMAAKRKTSRGGKNAKKDKEA